MMRFWDAVASAGQYANNLHFAPDRQPHQHLITQVLQAGCSSSCPANSIKALKATLKFLYKIQVNSIGRQTYLFI